MNKKRILCSEKANTAKMNYVTGYLPSYVFMGLALVVTSILIPELALAGAGYDINGAAVAATSPLIKAVEDHWSKVVLLTAATYAVFGEGDTRERAIKAGKGAGIAGAVIIGIFALFK